MKDYISWIKLQDSPDYISNNDSYRAFYIKTIKGYACYDVYKVNDKRTKENKLSTGGLPDWINI